MTRVLVVDWLGRGGIAQTSESWARELAAAGAEVRIATRLGRELAEGPIPLAGTEDRGGALRSHLRLCRAASREIAAWRPEVVVVQNYLVPLLEWQVHAAARRVGARVVVVVHDHRHHEWREGLHLGLGRLLRRADLVVAHTAAVAGALGRIPAEVVPHPVPLGLVERRSTSPVARPPGGHLALQFGVLDRAYKGTATTVALAEAGVPGWSFALAGSGAPAARGAQQVDRFLDPGELVAAVMEADVVLLPYTHATQSGAVVLAQLCGTPVVATAVGGIVEQIEDRVTGVLLPPGAPPSEWATVLYELEVPAVRQRLAEAGRASVWAQHEAFRAGVRRACGLAASAPVTGAA